jgi:hypothetical protein
MGLTLDVTLISGFRPDLLRQTLASFDKYLFRHFDVANAYVNLDPFMGTIADGNECEEIVRGHFDRPVIRRPEDPSFGAAVKHVWSATGANHVLHLEDDWLCLSDVTPTMVTDAFGEKTGMVAMAHKPQRSAITIGRRKRKYKLFGMNIYSRWISKFGTSPAFIRPGLCREYGLLIDPTKDPEKQVYRNANKKLCALQEKYEYRVLAGAAGEPIIADIGRDYRDARQVKKINLQDGASYWTAAD